MKVNFKLPNTRLCLVVWFRNNRTHETILETPYTNEQLRQRMLEQKVGFSELRAVKSVDGDSLAQQMTRLN